MTTPPLPNLDPSIPEPPKLPDLTPMDRVIPNDPLRGGEATSLSTDQAWANRPDFQKQYPALTEMWKYRHPYAFENKDTAMDYGQRFQSWLQKPNMLSNLLDSGVMPAAVGGALGMGGLAMGGSWLKNKFSDEENQTDTFRNTLLGLLGGGGLAAWLAFQRGQQPKAAFYNSSQAAPDLRSMVLEMIARTGGISNNERFQYMAAVPQLSDSDLRQLARVLQTAIGAGAGALLARFFMGKGLGATAAGALLGGLTANAFNRPFTTSGGNTIMQTRLNGTSYAPF